MEDLKIPSYDQYKFKSEDPQKYQEGKQKAKQRRADFSLFESSMFKLLSQVNYIQDVQFALQVDRSHQKDHLGRTLPKLQPKVKASGAESHPDAELYQANQSQFQLAREFKGRSYKALTIVVDMKYYRSELRYEAYYKTVHDVEIRNDAKTLALGLLIVSEETKLNLLEEIEEKVPANKRLAILQVSNSSPGEHNTFEENYVNAANLNSLKVMLESLVAEYYKLCKVKQVPRPRDASPIVMLKKYKIRPETVKEKVEEEKQTPQPQDETPLNVLAESIAEAFIRAEDNWEERLRIIQENGLRLTQRNKVDRRTKLGKAVQALIDQEYDKKKEEMADEARVIKEQKQAYRRKLKEAIPPRYSLQLPELELEEAKLSETLTDALSLACSELHTFYRKLLASPKKLQEAVLTASVGSDLKLLQEIKEEFGECQWHDPFPYDELWVPFKSQDALTIPWTPKQISWGEKEVSSNYYCNPPFWWSEMATVICIKAHLANMFHKSRIICILPIKQWLQVNPKIREELKVTGNLKTKNLGFIQFKGYLKQTPFELIQLKWF